MTIEEQIKKLSQLLQTIYPSVTKEDREVALIEFNCSSRTIIRYLKNGEVRNIDLALNLYQFLNKRIEQRKNIIKEEYSVIA